MYRLLVNFFEAADFVSALGAATVAVTGTDSAATALIAAVDSNVSIDFFDMNPSGDA
jgi:hypothetical protein